MERLKRASDIDCGTAAAVKGGKTCDCSCECTCSIDSVTDDTMTSTRDSNMLSTFAT
ncbi:MAG: hypothetical protein U9R40_02490 [Synergistota bacterium]|nr:hypothetical protein [Synergistota bacterium]